MISPEELLEYSRKLYDLFDSEQYFVSNKEVEYRNCARISYYALYHRLKLIADQLPGKYVKVQGVHEQVILKLYDSNIEKLMELAEILKACKTTRVKADYYLDKELGKKETNKILQKAEKVFYNLKSK